ncbi:hypothetical protein MMC15_008407, partial [Xylographa vitiligo]|nr:hypothetical protein [Xylographa vitiligo]
MHLTPFLLLRPILLLSPLLCLLPLSLLTTATPLPSTPLPLPFLTPLALTPCAIFGSAVVPCYEGPGTGFTAAATVHGGHFYQCRCAVAAGEDVDGNR